MVLTGQVLEALGVPAAEAGRTLETFRDHDERTVSGQHAIYRDEARLIQTSREAAGELQSRFEADRGER